MRLSQPPVVAQKPSAKTSPAVHGGDFDWSRHIVSVPSLDHIRPTTEDCLRQLERRGARVDRSYGCSAIDLARSSKASQALHEGMESILFIDADIRFDPADAEKLLRSTELLISGAYAAKRWGPQARFALSWDQTLQRVKFGEQGGLYPVDGCGAGFMRIKCSLLRRMIDEIPLPSCKLEERDGWPLFLPVVAELAGHMAYLTEDMAFCWRARQLGVQPLVDTRIRLYHLGEHTFGFEEACQQYIPRMANLDAELKRSRP